MDSETALTAEAKYRELLERYPENVFVKDQLADILRSQGRDDEAGRILPFESGGLLKYHLGLLTHDERLREHPDDWVEYLNRGIWHHWHQSYQEALSDYDRAIRIAPTIAFACCSARACGQRALKRHSGMVRRRSKTPGQP